MDPEYYLRATGVPDRMLVFATEPPANFASSAEANATWDLHAQGIAQALYRTLPAGVLDRLAAHLLLLVASQLRPTYPQRNMEDVT